MGDSLCVYLQAREQRDCLKELVVHFPLLGIVFHNNPPEGHPVLEQQSHSCSVRYLNSATLSLIK